MQLPKDPSKYINNWRYLEVGKYVPKLKKIIRKQDNKKPILLEWPDVEGYRRENDNTGIYASVAHYNNRNIDRATRLSSLYFDLDSVEVSKSQEEAIKLVEYLSDFISLPAIRIYYSGQKGFHIECEAIAVGIGPSNDLSRLFRYIAGKLRDKLSLTTLDFSVYDDRRMWRIPNSRHQHTGLYKVELGKDLLAASLLEIQEYAEEPKWKEIPEQVFDAKANEWYREWVYKEYEENHLTIEDRIARFSKLGTAQVRKDGPGELRFDPEKLFTQCHAMNDLWKMAEEKHDLPHEARLFLCSILTYTPEAQQYLHAILRNCDDYNESKSQSHIDDWIRRREMGIGGRPYSCSRANSAGVGCGDCDLEPKERYEKIGDKWVGTGTSAAPSPLRYAYFRKRD